MEPEKGRLKGRHTDEVVGSPISLKHVYEIAKIKRGELRLSGLSEEGVVRCVVAQAKTVGVVVKV